MERRALGEHAVEVGALVVDGGAAKTRRGSFTRQLRVAFCDCRSSGGRCRLYALVLCSVLAFMALWSQLLQETSSEQRVEPEMGSSFFASLSMRRGGANELVRSDDLGDYAKLWRRREAHRKTFPRLLHQSWPTRQVPKNLGEYMQAWRKIQPSWGYKLHTDDDNARLVEARYSSLVPTYMRLSPIQKADIARLLYMHTYGGVYADLDVELLRPLRPLLTECAANKTSALIGQEPLAHSVLLEGKPRQACNAVLASARGHPFWLWAVHRSLSAMEAADDLVGGDPVATTGPRMLEASARLWNERYGTTELRLLVSDPNAFYPLWDSRQAETFQQKCSAEGRQLVKGEALASGSGVSAETVDAVCDQLARDKFVPTLPADGSAFATHHWAHTWLSDGQSSADTLHYVDAPPDAQPPEVADAILPLARPPDTAADAGPIRRLRLAPPADDTRLEMPPDSLPPLERLAAIQRVREKLEARAKARAEAKASLTLGRMGAGNQVGGQ